MPKFTEYAQGTPCWIELVSTDVKAGSQFYADLFGWELVENVINEGLYVVARKDDERIGGLTGLMPGAEGAPTQWAVYLAVDDVDASTAKVAAAGGTVEEGPFDVTTLGRMSMIQDPNGARVNLWQAVDLVGTGLANEPGTPIFNEVVTADVDRAAAFYTEVLGTGTQVFDMEDGESYTCLTNQAGEVIGGAVPPTADGVPPHWNVYFNVEDADAAAVRIEELGGSTVEANYDVPGIGRMGFYADPQGGGFAILQSPPAA